MKVTPTSHWMVTFLSEHIFKRHTLITSIYLKAHFQYQYLFKNSTHSLHFQVPVNFPLSQSWANGRIGRGRRTQTSNDPPLGSQRSCSSPPRGWRRELQICLTSQFNHHKTLCTQKYFIKNSKSQDSKLNIQKAKTPVSQCRLRGDIPGCEPVRTRNLLPWSDVGRSCIQTLTERAGFESQ